jgi:hypothetical protein
MAAKRTRWGKTRNANLRYIYHPPHPGESCLSMASSRVPPLALFAQWAS